MKKNEAERALNRVENCKTVKTEIDHIISNESEEVSQWLIECQSDKQELGNLHQNANVAVFNHYVFKISLF